MHSSLKIINGNITFVKFCKIIDQCGGRASERDGLRGVYDSHKEMKGQVTIGDATLIANTIVAQDLNYEW